MAGKGGLGAIGSGVVWGVPGSKISSIEQPSGELMTKRNVCAYLDKPASCWIESLKDPDPLVRRLASHALAEIGPPAREEAIPGLTAVLKDETSFVRVWAAAALARVDPGNRVAISGLIECTKDELYFVRSLAAWHLGRLGPDARGVDEAIPQLKKLLEDRDPSVRTEANVALKRLRSRSKAHVG